MMGHSIVGLQECQAPSIDDGSLLEQVRSVLPAGYIPFSTGKSTGLPEKPVGKMPWVMFSGPPKAHIMFTPGM
jgi:hypothetical protein